MTEHRLSHSASYDVIVLGGGGSGLAAAIEAAESGRSVMLLEKNAKLGGSTAWSVGSVSSTLTPHQIRSGIKDRPSDHFTDLGRFNARVSATDNEVLRRLLVEGTPETFRWLVASGIEFIGPMPEPPNRQPRMHNVLPHSRSFIHHLAKRARQAGVAVATNAQVIDLSANRDGGWRVVAARHDAQSLYSARAVVIATGDFGGSAEMKRQFVSSDIAEIDAVNNHNTGDGHRLALKLGARILNGHLVHGPEVRFVPPKRSLLQAIPPVRPIARMIAWALAHVPAQLLRPFLMRFLTTTLAPTRNLFEQGARLVNSRGHQIAGSHATHGRELARQPDKLGFIVFDDATAKLFSGWPHYISTAPGIAYAYLQDYRRSRRDIFHRAATVRALAERLDMDDEALTAALAGRATPPFYALGPVRSYIIFTDGGLAIDADCRVLDSRNAPIPGLFAAGAAGQGGLLLEGHGHHLAWAFTSGRLAGRNAALETVSAPISEIADSAATYRSDETQPLAS